MSAATPPGRAFPDRMPEIESVLSDRLILLIFKQFSYRSEMHITDMFGAQEIGSVIRMIRRGPHEEENWENFS
jgi:hypothetical protein